jgi:threonine dehydratase
MGRLNLANIEKAARLIDPLFLHSPQYEDGTLNAALGQRVLVKVETANPIRSFKGRRGRFLRPVSRPQTNDRVRRQLRTSMAYVGGSRRIPVQVFVANDVNPAKADRMRSLGATLVLLTTRL